MTTVLILRSSILGDASASNLLIDEAIASLRADNHTVQIIERNLVSDVVPHFDGQAAAAMLNEPAIPAEQNARALSDTLIAEVKAADILLIGAPMYNFGIPSVLKSWFDHVLRAGVTFRYTEAGPEGLMTGKAAIIVQSRGGSYSEGPSSALDAQTPHLRALLGFIGIDDQTYILAEQLAFGPEAREASISAAKTKLMEAFGAVLDIAA